MDFLFGSDRRGLAPGREISEAAYLQLRAQHRQHDAALALALGLGPISEGVPLSIEPEPEGEGEGEGEGESGGQHGAPPFVCRTLDLSDEALFGRLGEAGLDEILALCPGLTALFLPPRAGARLTEGLRRLTAPPPPQHGSTAVPIAWLGRELSRAELGAVLEGCRRTRTLDLSRDPALWARRLSERGLAELVQLMERCFWGGALEAVRQAFPCWMWPMFD
jgi:hypothetical protein